MQAPEMQCCWYDHTLLQFDFLLLCFLEDKKVGK